VGSVCVNTDIKAIIPTPVKSSMRNGELQQLIISVCKRQTYILDQIKLKLPSMQRARHPVCKQ